MDNTNFKLESKTPLQKLPSRIKYYLLEWKNNNLNEFLDTFGNKGLNDLDNKQLIDLFHHASSNDYLEFKTN